MDNIKEKIKTLSDETISNMLNQRKNNNSSFKDFLIDEQKKRKKHNHLMATNWKYYIREAIKTGLESPTPYKVIPYKNGIGIKKIEFINIPIVKTEKRVNEIMEDMLSIEDPQSL